MLARQLRSIVQVLFNREKLKLIVQVLLNRKVDIYCVSLARQDNSKTF